MISLISKVSSKIEFPVTSNSIGAVHPKQSAVIIESGVAVISFAGLNAFDWTRDVLSIPVGRAIPPANFFSGIASGSPTSFWSVTPIVVDPRNAKNEFAVRMGCAVDSATVDYSSEAGQPVATFSLAVFGDFTSLLRVSYTVHIVLGEPGIVVAGNAGAEGAQGS